MSERLPAPAEWDESLVQLYNDYMDLAEKMAFSDPAAEADSVDYEDPPEEEDSE